MISSRIMQKQFIITGLTPGNTYRIRVQSRNNIGLSANSNTLTVIAAIVPTACAKPTTMIDVNNVVIDWNVPSS